MSLRWRQVRFDLNESPLRSDHTKARRPWDLPMSQTLRARLEMRYDPDDEIFPGDANPFGDELGGQIKSVQKAWSTLRLRLVGHGPHWIRHNKLAPCCRENWRS